MVIPILQMRTFNIKVENVLRLQIYAHNHHSRASPPHIMDMGAG